MHIFETSKLFLLYFSNIERSSCKSWWQFSISVIFWKQLNLRCFCIKHRMSHLNNPKQMMSFYSNTNLSLLIMGIEWKLLTHHHPIQFLFVFRIRSLQRHNSLLRWTYAYCWQNDSLIINTNWNTRQNKKKRHNHKNWLGEHSLYENDDGFLFSLFF